jgi:predicted lipoprotein with Yx(FWY)xxD motif
MPYTQQERSFIMNRIRHLAIAIAAVVLAACSGMYAKGDAAPAMAREGVLTNSAGMTLYTFDRDPADASKSVCNGPCAVNWPPLMAGADARSTGDWAVVTRDDGARQWAYKGRPLYLWIKDAKPGDKTGDGVNNVWHVAKP